MCFGSPELGHTIKTSSINVQNVKIFFSKGSETSFSTMICVWFFKKNVCQVIFYKLAKLDFLIAAISLYIREFVC